MLGPQILKFHTRTPFWDPDPEIPEWDLPCHQCGYTTFRSCSASSVVLELFLVFSVKDGCLLLILLLVSVCSLELLVASNKSELLWLQGIEVAAEASEPH